MMRARELMLLCLTLLLAVATWGIHRYYVTTRDQDPTALFMAVEEQLVAFRQQNFDSAYYQASFNIQAQWSLEQYVGRVRRDYASVMQAESIEFGPWQRRGKQATVQVFFVHPNGSVSPCIYSLVFEDSKWKVDNARWIRGWPTGQRMRGIRS